jgi:hypothetical protein
MPLLGTCVSKGCAFMMSQILVSDSLIGQLCNVYCCVPIGSVLLPSLFLGMRVTRLKRWVIYWYLKLFNWSVMQCLLLCSNRKCVASHAVPWYACYHVTVCSWVLDLVSGACVHQVMQCRCCCVDVPLVLVCYAMVIAVFQIEVRCSLLCSL